MNAVYTALTWDDHTPEYLDGLGVPQHGEVKVRLRTDLKPEQVFLMVNIYGEINQLPAQKLAQPDPEAEWFEATLPLPSAKTQYAWLIACPDDTWFYSKAGLSHSHRGYRDFFSYLAGYEAPEWVYSSAFYQIFPDRFKDGDPTSNVQDGEYLYQGKHVTAAQWHELPDKTGDVHAHYGGDLQGIEQAIPYLTRLGVNGLWLTPIFTSPSNHKYDITDYLAIDPHFGGEAAFDSLMAKSKQAGIKIVLDGVFNHMGADNKLFATAYTNPQAPERALFTWKYNSQTPDARRTHEFIKTLYIDKSPLKQELEWEEVKRYTAHMDYEAFFNAPSLPKINYQSPEATDYFITGENSVVRHWLKKGIAGWRLDVAQQMGKNGTDEGNLELHQQIAKAAKTEKADAYIFGERFFDAEHALNGSGEQAVMNYHGFGMPVGTWFAGMDYQFRPVQMPTEDLVDILWDAYRPLAPEVALMQYNLLDSHDLPRILYRLNGDKHKLRSALAMLYSYVGVPAIFYGTEIGLSQHERGAMPYCRVPMPWDETTWDTDLLSYTQKLIHLRKTETALQRGSLRFIYAAGNVLAYQRCYNSEKIVVLVSRGETPEPFNLAGEYIDLISGTEYQGTFTGAAILKERI